MIERIFTSQSNTTVDAPLDFEEDAILRREITVKQLSMTVTVLALLAAPAMAAFPFFDDFEGGDMSNWTQTPGSLAALSINGPDTFKNIVPGGGEYSARQSALVVSGAGVQSYHNFGPQSGAVFAEAYMFEDLTTFGDPVQGGITLTAQNGGGEPDFAEFLRIGVLQFAGTNQFYSFRTNTGGFVTTNVARKSGWTKFNIEADALGDGGQVRFYIDDALVGTSVRSGADLSVITLGQNFSNLENFWYDGVSVTPEPASLMLLGLGGLALLHRRRHA